MFQKYGQAGRYGVGQSVVSCGVIRRCSSFNLNFLVHKSSRGSRLAWRVANELPSPQVPTSLPCIIVHFMIRLSKRYIVRILIFHKATESNL